MNQAINMVPFVNLGKMKNTPKALKLLKKYIYIIKSAQNSTFQISMYRKSKSLFSN